MGDLKGWTNKWMGSHGRWMDEWTKGYIDTCR